jgi:flagellar FliL protein
VPLSGGTRLAQVLITNMSDTPEVPKKAGKSSLVIIIAAVVAVAVAGGAAFWYARRTAPAIVVEVHAKNSERGLLSLEPFVVNLADPSGSRFLRATVQLIVKDEAEAEHIKKSPAAMMQTRGAILELLTVQTADNLVTPDGKTALKKLIAERASTALDDTKVIDVLFSDFVVQF